MTFRLYLLERRLAFFRPGADILDSREECGCPDRSPAANNAMRGDSAKTVRQ
jgi:hypothetical protein